MLNQSAEYAIRVAARLADVPCDSWSDAANLADELDIPANYLSKLMHQLVGSGILESRRGRGGGFRLARAARELTLREVVTPFDPPDRWHECFLGGKRCSAASACEVHDVWKPIAVSMSVFLSNTTVAQLAARRVARPRGRKRTRGAA